MEGLSEEVRLASPSDLSSELKGTHQRFCSLLAPLTLPGEGTLFTRHLCGVLFCPPLWCTVF